MASYKLHLLCISYWWNSVCYRSHTNWYGSELSFCGDRPLEVWHDLLVNKIFNTWDWIPPYQISVFPTYLLTHCKPRQWSMCDDSDNCLFYQIKLEVPFWKVWNRNTVNLMIIYSAQRSVAPLTALTTQCFLCKFFKAPVKKNFSEGKFLTREMQKLD